ncbi:hypothetical protein [Chryseobacterium sp. A321]
MKKFIAISLLSLLAMCTVSTKSDRLLSVSNLLKMNSEQIDGLKSISIEEHNGFKYLKNEVKTKVFNSVSSTSNSSSLNQEDEQKIVELLKKYK